MGSCGAATIASEEIYGYREISRDSGRFLPQGRHQASDEECRENAGEEERVF